MKKSFLSSVAACLVLLLSAGQSLAAAETPDAFSQAVSRGPVYAVLAALVGGLLVSLTPCVYPMIAITVSVFGARQSTSRWQGLSLSASFVAGIVALFTPLGVVAGLTGGMFGAVLPSTWVLVGISVLFLALSASMFGAFDLTLPSALVNRLNRVGGMGAKGAFGLGLVCGLIAAPCTGPVLTGILTWIAKSQSASLGALAMGSFSLGLGMPFFVVGAFAMQLPKSGPWMVHVKSVFGLVLAVVALYFLSTAFPALSHLGRADGVFLGVAAGLAALGLLLGAVHRDFHSPDLQDRVLKGAGVLVTTLASFAFIAGMSAPERTLSWKTMPLAEARSEAARSGRPLLVDFTASWCGACKQLERETFAAPEVANIAGRFLAVKVDASNDEDPAVQSAMESVGVRGLPTVIVFDSAGKEAVRYTDFVPPDRFVDAITKVN